MNVKELRQVLEEAEAILAASGATAQTKNFKLFLELFKGRDDQPVSQFLAELKLRLCPPTSDTVELPKINEPVVERYVQRLRDAGIDNNIFDNIFSELLKDKQISKEDADAIAHRYTKGRDRWPTKAAALQELKTRFGERVYQAAKMTRVDKIGR